MQGKIGRENQKNALDTPVNFAGFTRDILRGGGILPPRAFERRQDAAATV